MGEQDYEKMICEMYEQIINKKDADAADRYFTKDVVMEDGRLTINGLEEAKRLIKERSEAIPDYKCKVDDVVISKNKGVARWEAHGMPLKDTGDFKAGKPIDYRGITLFELDGDKVSRVWQYGTGVDIG